MSAAVRRRLGGGRWHFQHGPIDCIVDAKGDPDAVADANERAWARFEGVLAELVGELPLLRADLSSPAGGALDARGRVARRMIAACRRHAGEGRFITAMAAVAGSVAEELIGFFVDPRIARASVNNGGDIALHLREGEHFDIGVVADPIHAVLASIRHPERSEGSRPANMLDGHFRIDSRSPIRGIATSGWRGRSFSLGIADAVTALAATASDADAAATVIANAVAVDSPAIVRRPANTVRDDSDLGARLVTVAVPALSCNDVARALDRGARQARLAIAAGHVVAAVLQLQGVVRVCGELAPSTAPHPSPLPASGARESCPAPTPASGARESCPAPTPASGARESCPAPTPASGARESCPAPSPASRERVGVRAATSHAEQESLPC